MRIRTLARDIVLCSWARHFTLTVPLSTQENKWVPANLLLEGNPAMDQHLIQGRLEILSVISCYRNQDKLRPDGPLRSNSDVTFLCEKNFPLDSQTSQEKLSLHPVNLHGAWSLMKQLNDCYVHLLCG